MTTVTSSVNRKPSQEVCPDKYVCETNVITEQFPDTQIGFCISEGKRRLE